MRVTVEVIGMKAFRGTIDGSAIDSGTVYTRVKLDASNNKSDGTGLNFKAGEVTEEWKLPNSAAVVALKDHKLPFMAHLETERVSNGRETKEIVTGITPAVAEGIRKVA